jgi:protein-disulfide isomerase
LIAVGVVLMWPLALRREGTATSSFDEAIDTPRSISLSKPSALAVLLTTLAIIGFSYAHWNMFAMKHWRKTADSWLSTCRASLSKSLLNNWWQQPEHQIPSRPDDPVRRLGAATGQPVNIVIFSDFECPSCQRFAEGFEKQIVPLFTQPVSVTFKHYPLDQACNQFASRTLHAHACQAARWAEAARITGGNDAFWRAHDFLFAHREDLATGQLSVEQFAEALGFDAAAITQQAERIAVTSRITEDVAAARGANVIGTPAVFVEGKAIDQVARGELAFWQGLVDVLTRRGQAAREFSLENK